MNQIHKYNKEELKTYLAKEYAVNNYEESTQYVCKDQYMGKYKVWSLLNVELLLFLHLVGIITFIIF